MLESFQMLCLYMCAELWKIRSVHFFGFFIPLNMFLITFCNHLSVCLFSHSIRHKTLKFWISEYKINSEQKGLGSWELKFWDISEFICQDKKWSWCDGKIFPIWLKYHRMTQKHVSAVVLENMLSHRTRSWHRLHRNLSHSISVLCWCWSGFPDILTTSPCSLNSHTTLYMGSKKPPRMLSIWKFEDLMIMQGSFEMSK